MNDQARKKLADELGIEVSKIDSLLPSEPAYLKALVAGLVAKYRAMGNAISQIEESLDRLERKKE